MAKFRNAKNSFIGGQISPTAFGRTDIALYGHSCKLMKNMIPMLSGGAYRRPGTVYQDSVAAATYGPPALLPFSASDAEGYCISLYGRISDGVGFVEAYRATSNTAAASTSTITGTHTYNPYYLDQVQYVQSADVLYTANTSSTPTNFIKTATDAFTVQAFDAGLSGTAYRDCRPYRTMNATSTLLNYGATFSIGTGRTLTSSAAFFTGTSADVGRIFKIKHTDNTISCCKITAAINTTSATVQIYVAGTDATAHGSWWESAWSNYQGWPRTVTFFKQRLVYGGTTLSPDSLWFSYVSNYNVFSVTATQDPKSETDASSPFTIELASTELNQIQWAVAGDTLTVGTLGDEWIISQESGSSGFSAATSPATTKTKFGSSYHAAVKVGNEVFFVNKSDDTVRALVYSNDDQSYVAEPLQLLFNEYPRAIYTGIRSYRRIQWDASRDTLWCVDNSGSIFGMTRDRRLSITMWHTHVLGGALDYPTITGQPPAVVSVTVVPNALLGMDDLWISVQRTINGGNVYHIERMIGGNVAFDTAYFQNSCGVGTYQSDSSVFKYNDYPAAETYVRDGLGHLEGEELEGMASNSKGYFKITTGAVTAGEATISAPYPGAFTAESTAEVYGLHYDSVIIPVQVDAGSQVGSSIGANKRIHEATVKLYKTLACKVGGDANNTETIDFRTVSTPMQNSAELFTGDKTVKVDCDYTKEGYIYIAQTEPLPFTVISVVTEGNTYD